MTNKYYSAKDIIKKERQKQKKQKFNQPIWKKAIVLMCILVGFLVILFFLIIAAENLCATVGLAVIGVLAVAIACYISNAHISKIKEIDDISHKEYLQRVKACLALEGIKSLDHFVTMQAEIKMEIEKKTASNDKLIGACKVIFWTMFVAPSGFLLSQIFQKAIFNDGAAVDSIIMTVGWLLSMNLAVIGMVLLTYPIFQLMRQALNSESDELMVYTCLEELKYTLE